MLLTLIPDPLRRSVANARPDRGETRFELSFRASTPSGVLPLGISQHVFSRDRQNIRNRALTRTAALGDWPDHLHVDRVHLEMARDANRPSQATRREPLPEWRAQSIPGICEHTAEVNSGCNHAVDLSERDPKTMCEALDAAIIFAPVGALIPTALKAVRKGGRVVCAGIHM